MNHKHYLRDALALAASLPNFDWSTFVRVKKHLADRHRCPDCLREAETESFPAEEIVLRDAENDYLRKRFPGKSVGSVKLRHAPLGDISLMLEGKHLYASHREADRDAAWLFHHQMDQEEIDESGEKQSSEDSSN